MGQTVLEVEDAFLPENSGRWRIAGGERRADGRGGLTSRSTSVSLARSYLGGFTFGELLRRAGTVRELRDGGAARADVFLDRHAQALVP